MPSSSGLLLASLVVLAACQAPSDSGAQSEPAPVAGEAAAQPTAGGPPPGIRSLPREGGGPSASPSPAVADALVALALADAAPRASVHPSDLRVVTVEPREWPDRSLGCPKPGVGYAQSLTPGFLIVVEGGGHRFEYHADHAQVTLCEA